jgi:hypothetical protein
LPTQLVTIAQEIPLPPCNDQLRDGRTKPIASPTKTTSTLDPSITVSNAYIKSCSAEKKGVHACEFRKSIQDHYEMRAIGSYIDVDGNLVPFVCNNRPIEDKRRERFKRYAKEW